MDVCVGLIVLSARSVHVDEIEACLAPDYTVVRADQVVGDEADTNHRRSRALVAFPEQAAAVLVIAETVSTERVADTVGQLRYAKAAAPLLVLTLQRDSDDIMEILKAGADDFATLPVSPFALRARLKRMLDDHRPTDPVVASLKAHLGLGHIIGESPAFLAAIRLLPIFARCDANILIDGETGSGKEVCARAIHYLSARSRKPFTPVNCGALPEHLLENELFGHAKSAYTGALSNQPGLIAESEGGTVFLDEIDAIPSAAQVKLLRLLQEKEYRPLGTSKTQRADVRFITASNADLAAQVKAGRLREDFWYRISTLRLMLPPLRERAGDVLLLANHFLVYYAKEYALQPRRMSKRAAQTLFLHRWPGNVRELEHVIERAVILAQDRAMIEPEDLQLPGVDPSDAAPAFRCAKRRAIAAFEIAYLSALLEEHAGNVTHAAAAAGKDPRALRHLIHKHSINPQAFRIPHS